MDKADAPTLIDLLRSSGVGRTVKKLGLHNTSKVVSERASALESKMRSIVRLKQKRSVDSSGTAAVATENASEDEPAAKYPRVMPSATGQSDDTPLSSLARLTETSGAQAPQSVNTRGPFTVKCFFRIIGHKESWDAVGPAAKLKRKPAA